jgi:hypothetical protein
VALLSAGEQGWVYFQVLFPFVSSNYTKKFDFEAWLWPISQVSPNTASGSLSFSVTCDDKSCCECVSVRACVLTCAHTREGSLVWIFVSPPFIPWKLVHTPRALGDGTQGKALGHKGSTSSAGFVPLWERCREILGLSVLRGYSEKAPYMRTGSWS